MSEWRECPQCGRYTVKPLTVRGDYLTVDRKVMTEDGWRGVYYCERCGLMFLKKLPKEAKADA